MGAMNVYECRRKHPDGWAGVLIVAAEDEERAIQLYALYENDAPHSVMPWEGVTATGEARLLIDFTP